MVPLILLEMMLNYDCYKLENKQKIPKEIHNDLSGLKIKLKSGKRKKIEINPAKYGA